MKRIIAILLAVVLVAGGLGSFAYAQATSHVPMSGKKIVGVGQLGKGVPEKGVDTKLGKYGVKGVPEKGVEIHYWSFLEYTNPDCADNITIRKISVVRMDGKVIYEGPPLILERNADGEVVKEKRFTLPMKPHEIRSIKLHHFMKNPEAANPKRWLTPREAVNLPLATYTVEIFWGRAAEGPPLLGWISVNKLQKKGGEPILSGLSRTEMVLLQQP